MRKDHQNKNKYRLDRMIINVWNDYSSGEMKNYIFSPDV